MQGVHANLSYDFVFPKLHGIWARSFSGERLRRLVAGQDIQALGRELNAVNIDIADRREVQKQLFTHLIHELAQIERLLDERVAPFYECQIQRFYFENLKTLLHYRYFRTDTSDIQHLLILAPELPELQVDQLLAARTVHQFYQLLPAHELKTRLLPILVELDDRKDLFVAESRIDQVFFKWQLERVAGLPRKLHGPAEELVRTEIDLINIVMVLRNAAVYEMDPGTIVELGLSGGYAVTSGQLERIARKKLENEIVAALPVCYRRVLEPLIGERMYVQEVALWGLIARQARDLFRDFDRAERSVAAFPYLKRCEYLNVSRLFEGLYLRLGSDVVRSMLIGVT